MKRLDQEERYQIYAMKRAGFSQKTIADELGRNSSTICRELKRNTGKKGYRPKQAHEKAIAREANKPKSRKVSAALLFKINEKLQLDWSPEPIFGLVGFSQKKDADSVKKELISMFKPIKECVKTITADNGKEFAGHEDVARVIEAGYYFAHPYRSCERGLNENTNGLIRQYFPKGKDLRGVTKNELQKIMSRLNNRPRKTLDYKLPKILFKLERSKIALVA
jgi:IS30 family transposase